MSDLSPGDVFRSVEADAVLVLGRRLQSPDKAGFYWESIVVSWSEDGRRMARTYQRWILEQHVLDPELWTPFVLAQPTLW